jgi:hypothetical protein
MAGTGVAPCSSKMVRASVSTGRLLPAQPASTHASAKRPVAEILEIHPDMVNLVAGEVGANKACAQPLRVPSGNESA